MINSTITQILRTLDKNEFTRLDEFVHSPYYNKRSAVIKFWDELKKFAPGYNSTELTHEVIYDGIFPGKGFNYGTLKNLIYEMTKLVETFLALQRSEEKPLQRFENLLEILLIKGLNSQFEKNFKDAEKYLENSVLDGSGYNKKHSLETLRQNYLIMNDKHYDTLASINDANRYLTLAYFMDTFVNNYNAVYMKTEIASASKVPLDDYLSKAISYYRSKPITTDYLIEIFYNAFMLAYEGSDENFYNLRTLLEENNSKLSNEEKYNFYVSLANFTDKKAENSPEFAKYQYEIYKYMIESSIYSISNISTIDGSFYRKAASAAELAGELDWALNFINEYKDKLDEGVRENYYQHALVEYYMAKKEFNTALEYLVRIKHTNPVDKLNIKAWQMVCYYELGYFEELRNIIDSIRHFITKDKKILASKKERLYNFMTFITKLLFLTENKNNNDAFAEVEMLKNEIKEADISHKNWLNEKLDSLRH